MLVLQAVTLCALPTHFFFQFLYYTDTASLLFVLMAYQVCSKEGAWPASAGLCSCCNAFDCTTMMMQRVLRQQWGLSAVCCAAGILVRQTNVVWCGFVLGVRSRAMAL